MKIAVLNLQSGIGVTKGYREYVTRGWRYILGHSGKPIQEAASMLATEQPDLVLVSEIDEPSYRSRYRSQVQQLKQGTDLQHTAFYATKIVGNAIQEGSAILSTLPFLETKKHPLRTGINPRVLGQATIEMEGVPVSVFVAHLALNTKRRHQQMIEIFKVLKEAPGPIIIGGDFNERKKVLRSLFEEVGFTAVTEPGYPSWKPKHALQALFVSPHFSVTKKYQPLSGVFSDHVPLFAEIELRT